jgi:hypothetical protein
MSILASPPSAKNALLFCNTIPLHKLKRITILNSGALQASDQKPEFKQRPDRRRYVVRAEADIR